MLSIYEELFLLVLDEEKGHIMRLAKRPIGAGLSGSILAELAQRGKIRINKKHRLEMMDGSPTNERIIDETIQEIQLSEKPRKATYWVNQINSKPKKIRDLVGESLVEKKILIEEDKSLFRATSEPAKDQPSVPSKFERKARLREMILGEGEVDYPSLALLNVVSACGLLNLLFTQDEMAPAERRIQEESIRAGLKDLDMQTIEEIGEAIASNLDEDEE